MAVDSAWLTSALWMGLALVSSLVSIRVAVSVALIEIFVGFLAGNVVGLSITPWVNYLAGVGSIMLTFLAGAEVDPQVIRKHFGSSIGIGMAGFLVPFAGILLFSRYALGWTWPQSQIAALALSTTSVAVVYAVMVETGLNQTELGKIILAACFINDLGTVVVLGALFANYDVWLAVFILVTAAAMWGIPKFLPYFFRRVGDRVSEPRIKFLFVLLFLLGGLGDLAKCEAILPAYLIGMVLASFFLKEKEHARRLRAGAFVFLTPFYFLKAGSLVKFSVVQSAFVLILIFLAVKLLTKFVGVWPLTKGFRFESREGTYTTLMMCTGLTFGTIASLFGLNNGIISQDQYTILVAAVIGSALLPTLVAQKWFQPPVNGLEEKTDV